MLKRCLIAVVFALILLGSAATVLAVPGLYQIVSVTEGDTVHTYLLDTEKGDVWELKQFKATDATKPYFIQIPKFDKEKSLIKWQDELMGVQK